MNEITPHAAKEIRAQKLEQDALAGGSLLKKNEFNMIIIGALAVTLVVFFVFFGFSDSKKEPATDTAVKTAGLEKRIADLETLVESLKEKASSARPEASPPGGDLNIGVQVKKTAGSGSAAVGTPGNCGIVENRFLNRPGFSH